MSPVAVALLHHPVLDREGAVVTTAVTNLDVHDIARSAHCHGVAPYFVVHPVAAQRALVERIRGHWVDGAGGSRIPDRRAPLASVTAVASLDEAVDRTPGAELWATSARAGATSLGWRAARERLATATRPVILLFGTGWGLAPGVLERCAVHLAPIESPRSDGYNHLSVRAAAAIAFDRLLGIC